MAAACDRAAPLPLPALHDALAALLARHLAPFRGTLRAVLQYSPDGQVSNAWRQTCAVYQGTLARARDECAAAAGDRVLVRSAQSSAARELEASVRAFLQAHALDLAVLARQLRVPDAQRAIAAAPVSPYLRALWLLADAEADSQQVAQCFPLPAVQATADSVCGRSVRRCSLKHAPVHALLRWLAEPEHAWALRALRAAPAAWRPLSEPAAPPDPESGFVHSDDVEAAVASCSRAVAASLSTLTT